MSNITLTIPNDDHIALRAFGKALEEMALAHGAEPRKTTVGELSYKLNIDTSEATAALERLNTATGELTQAAPRMMDELRIDGAAEIHGKRKELEVDTTAQQVESLSDEFEQIVDDVKVAASEFLNVPAHVLTGQEVPPNTDKSGTPWDARIHSASKALNTDGTWRLRRKPKDMDELEWSDYVSLIKADLQYPVECGGEKEESAGGDLEENEQISNENNDIIPAEIEPPVTPPGDDYHTDAGVVTEHTVAGIPPIPVPPPVVVPPVTDWTFPKLMTFLTERQGKIDVPTVNMLLAQDGIASLPELNAHVDKIGPFVARVKAHLGE